MALPPAAWSMRSTAGTAHLRSSRLLRPSSPFSSATHCRNAVLYKRMEGVLTMAR